MMLQNVMRNLSTVAATDERLKMSTALIKLKEVKHPISEETIGFRFQAAHPNRAGRNRKGDEIPSFAKKYLIAESSDYPSVTETEFDKFTKSLSLFGFTEFPIVSTPKG